MTRHRRQRIPRLCFTKTQGIGWHVPYRDPVTGTPRRVRFGLIERRAAESKHHAWLSAGLGLAGRSGGDASDSATVHDTSSHSAARLKQMVPGNLPSVAAQILKLDETRTRNPGEPRTRGTIDSLVA